MDHLKQKFISFCKWVCIQLLPPRCLLCKNALVNALHFCDFCLNILPFHHHGCLQCAAKLTHEKLYCGKCLRLPPAFDVTYVLFYYEPPITRLILNLKFQQALNNAEALGNLLAKQIQHNWYATQSLPQAIFPVPLHKKRLRERGFNQALELARPIARQLNLPIDYQSCIRTKPTLAQARLPANKRKNNLRHAFQMVRSIPYSYIAVIDDIMTTGTTLHIFCKTLKKQGVKKIDVWCVARAIS